MPNSRVALGDTVGDEAVETDAESSRARPATGRKCQVEARLCRGV